MYVFSEMRYGIKPRVPINIISLPLYMCDNKKLVFCMVWQRKQRSESRSGTFSVLETGSTRTEHDRIEQRLQGIGRRPELISLFWVPLMMEVGVVGKLGWKKHLFSTEESPQKESKPIGLCMSIGLLITTPVTSHLGVMTWVTRRTPWG